MHTTQTKPFLSPDALAKQLFVLTMIGAAAFIVAVSAYVLA